MRPVLLAVVSLSLVAGCHRRLPPLATEKPFAPTVRTLDLPEPPPVNDSVWHEPEVDEPPPRPEMKAEPEPVLRLDEAAFDAAMPARGWTAPPPKPARRVQMVIVVQDNCPPCVPVKRDAAWFQKSGWLFGDDPTGHVWLADLNRDLDFCTEHNVTAAPVMLLFVDGNVVWRADEYTGRDDLIAKIRVAVEALPPLMRSDEGTFAAGELLSPEIVDYILRFFGDKPGRLSLVNNEYHFKHGTTSIDLPPQVAGNYTIAGGVKRIEFDAAKKPRGAWRFISSQVDAATLKGTVLTLELPGLPDPSIDLVR